jgi:hypothetical protein
MYVRYTSSLNIAFSKPQVFGAGPQSMSEFLPEISIGPRRSA